MAAVALARRDGKLLVAAAEPDTSAVRPAEGGGAGAVDDFEMVDCNEHGAVLCRQWRETLIGRRCSSLYGDDTFARLMALLRVAYDAGACDGELQARLRRGRPG